MAAGFVVMVTAVFAWAEDGRMIAMPWGGKLYLHCTGKGSPVVVIEYGFGDSASHWREVRERLAAQTRVCVYDRAGYGLSDAGPEPRTLAQLNLELRELLRLGGEKAPFLLVGHSFGGNAVRSYAARYREEVAGLILVDAVHGDQRIRMGPSRVARLRELASGRTIPEPALTGIAGQAADATQRSEGTWSEEQLALWHKNPQSLGDLPLLVISRAAADTSEMETDRLRLQGELAKLSSRGVTKQLACGHNMHVECPEALAEAIRSMLK